MNCLVEEFSRLLNEYNKDTACKTPDFMLAEYLEACLETFKKTMNRREEWFKQDKETELQKVPTNELVEELRNREGVESIETTPEGTDIIQSLNNSGLDDYEMKRGGPSIILRIID